MLQSTQCSVCVLAAAVLTVAGSGCATLTQSEIKFLETRELDLSYDDAYQAAANGLFSLGFTINHSDKESGILTGQRHDPRTGLKITNTILFGLLGLAATQSSDQAITFMLTSLEPEVTELRMKIVRDGKPAVDRKLMTKIWQGIEREAMLETRPSRGRQTQQDAAAMTGKHASTESESG